MTTYFDQSQVHSTNKNLKSSKNPGWNVVLNVTTSLTDVSRIFHFSFFAKIARGELSSNWLYIRDDFFYTMEKSWRSRRTRVRARTLRLASRSNDRILRPHWHDRCGHRSCAPHESAPGGGRDTRSQRARNLRQTISVSSTVFSTDTTERVACFSRGQSSTWMVRTSPTLGPLITARAPRESGSQPRRYHGVVEENARKCESERASARFRHRTTDATSGVRPRA